MSSSLRRIGRLVPSSSVLFVCDIQEVFRKTIHEMPTVIHSACTMVSAAQLLQIPTVVTTQYAARLGPTVPELEEKFQSYTTATDTASAATVQSFDKTRFSMLTDEVVQHLETLQAPTSAPASVLLCGIEGHVCVLQTCLDLLERGYEVHVLSDAVSSSTAYTRSVALERMRQSGAFITSVESSIFQLAGDAKHPQFRAISSLIKEHLKIDNGFAPVSTPRL